MKTNLRLAALCFAATAAFGQHGGGFRGGSFGGYGRGGVAFGGEAVGNRASIPGFPFPYALSGFSFPERALIPQIGSLSPLAATASRPRFVVGRWSGNNFFPFLPFYGDYGNGYPPGYGVYLVEPVDGTAMEPVEAKPIHSVIHEYPENENHGGATGGAATFSIALKDGSTSSAETVWVQQDHLHSVDSQGRQHVFSLDLIDRERTEHLNREKNLRFQLPPA